MLVFRVFAEHYSEEVGQRVLFNGHVLFHVCELTAITAQRAIRSIALEIKITSCYIFYSSELGLYMQTGSNHVVT